MRDFHETDGYADIEDLVLPHESIISHRVAYVGRDLTRLVQWTSHQQCPEFIPAEAPDEIRVADLVLDQGRHLAQHVVTGDMPAAVIHCLEAIQVHIKDDVNALFRVRRIDRFLQATFEFTAIDEPGQRIVSCLVAHLAGQSANFADVVKHHHRARNAITGATHWRRRDLDGMFMFAVAAYQQRTPSHVDPPAHRQAAFDRITEWSPVRLIDQREQFAELVPGRIVAIGPGHRFGGTIHVVDATLVVGSDDTFGNRLERILCLALAAT